MPTLIPTCFSTTRWTSFAECFSKDGGMEGPENNGRKEIGINGFSWHYFTLLVLIGGYKWL